MRIAAALVSSVLVAACSGCATAIVPVTPANASQVSACTSDSNIHTAMVSTGIGTGVVATVAGAVAAAVPGVAVGMAITSAIGAGLATGAAGGAALTSSSYNSDNCNAVMGPLPVAADHTTVTVSK